MRISRSTVLAFAAASLFAVSCGLMPDTAQAASVKPEKG